MENFWHIPLAELLHALPKEEAENLLKHFSVKQCTTETHIQNFSTASEAMVYIVESGEATLNLQPTPVKLAAGTVFGTFMPMQKKTECTLVAHAGSCIRSLPAEDFLEVLSSNPSAITALMGRLSQERSLYDRQIAGSHPMDRIIQDVHAGQISSESELQKATGLQKLTVKRAVQRLKEEGVIEENA